ncbi:AMP-binding protein [Microvirga sp. G4-2]|uniref:AMP-binding protein n=1 Tax=Microvirga sp. G4-2 TaxID=3434467 RepID=UPI004044AC1F
MKDNQNLQDYAWHPSPEFRAAANWHEFFKVAGAPDYETLAQRTVAEPEWFWNALIRYLKIPFLRPYERVLDTSEGIAWPHWCVGGTTNLVLACLDRHVQGGRGRHAAIVWEGEDGTKRTLSYAELHRESCRLAAGLKGLGIEKGAPVGLYLPMVPETAVAFLALARLGAVVVPLFSGYGADAIVSRLNDVNAVAVITTDGTLRRGNTVPMKSIIDEAARSIPTLRHVVVTSRLGLDVPMEEGRDIRWEDLCRDQSVDFPATELDAEAALMVIYTSGTTGKPKGTVHTHIGFTVKTGEDYHIYFDMKPEDRVLWMTDFGWLVGPAQLVATLLAGATLVLAEGVPDYPAADRLWRLVEAHKVSFLGMSPTLARLMRNAGEALVSGRDLSSIRVAASTGEPWDKASWLWIFEHALKRRAPLQNYSGGTEMGGILSTNILKPLKPASFSGPILGAGADIVDADGRSVGDNQVGELVMRAPCIGTTRGLWNDPERYIESYWSKIPGMWVQGDWAMRDNDGVWTIHGRSDDTIKIAGKRVGPAEIEALALATGTVADIAAVAVKDEIKGAAIVCVAVPIRGINEASVTAAIAQAISKGLGSSFRPKAVYCVSELPKTRNMKTMRRVIRAVLAGEALGDLSALLNPSAVDEIRRTVTGAAE